MPEFDAVIFDLDGTLLNTLEDLADSVNFALGSFGFAPRSIDEVRRFVGNGVRVLIERAVPEGTDGGVCGDCLAVFKEHYARNMENKTAPYDGILPMLRDVRALGCKTAIVSNKYDAAVKNLSAKWFGGMIDAAIGESPNVRRKPCPDSALAALRLLSVRSERALYVGDSDVDMMTAKAAEMTSVGVTWGFRSRDVLEKSGARFIIDRPAELLDILKRKNA